MRTFYHNSMDRAYNIYSAAFRRACVSSRCLPSFMILHRSSWRVSSAVAVRISCTHYALFKSERLFKDARIYESRSSKMSRAVSFFWYSRLERRAVAIYIENCTLMRTATTSNTSRTSFQHVKADSEIRIYCLRRALQSAVAGDAHRQPRT